MGFSSVVKQFVGLVLSFSLVQGSESFPCQDGSFSEESPEEENLLTKFDAYLHRQLRGPKKISFQRLSAEQCAQLCVQVAQANMYNCSSFEHVTNTNDCLLMDSICDDALFVVDNSSIFHQLQASNTTYSCETVSLSSTVSATSASSKPAASSVTASEATYHASERSNIVINITIFLSNESWDIALENRTSGEFIGLTTRLKQSVFATLDNHTSLLGVTVARFRNESGVVAEFNVAFTQDVHMLQMNRLYQALYVTKHLDTIPVRIITDTVAGKPPRGMSITLLESTVLQLSWSPEDAQQTIRSWGLRIVYKSHDNKTNSELVDKKKTQVNITGLHSETFYEVWSMSVSSIGFGPSSTVLNVTTPMQAFPKIVLKLTVLFVEVSWSVRLKNNSSDFFTNYSTLLEISLMTLHRNVSFYRNISDLQFRNHSGNTVADITVLYDHRSRVNDFFPLYTALHNQQRLGNLSVISLDDNIPGKPPTNLSAVAVSSSSISLHWDIARSNHCDVFQPIGFRVSYELLSSEQNTTTVQYIDTNSSSRYIVINNLEKYEYYEVWIQQLTSRGLGAESERVTVRTLDEVLSVVMTIRLTEDWFESLMNGTSVDFYNLSKKIERNVYLLYENGVHLRKVVCHNFVNDSGKVMAEIKITFGQVVEMSVFTRLYRALYWNGTVGNMTVGPKTDNIPGKPPLNVTLKAMSPTTLSVHWEAPYTTGTPSVKSLGLRIYYELSHADGNTSIHWSEETNITRGLHVLRNLAKFGLYTVWIRTVTSLGVGVESERVTMRTLEEVVSVNLSVWLINEQWMDDLSNVSSDLFIDLSENVTTALYTLFFNESLLRSVTCHRFRNDSGNVTANLEITFGQHVTMQLFVILYNALHKNGTFGDVQVVPLWDNIPGKPPNNISAVATSTSSIFVQWNLVQQSLDLLFLLVFYTITANPNATTVRIDVSNTENSVEILNLDKFVNYAIWIQSVTSRGPGIYSTPLFVRTLEEVVPVDLTVRFDIKWHQNLSDQNSDHFRNLSRQIKESVIALYGSESSDIRDVQCDRFRKGSVIADLSIVYGQNVGPKQFATIYQALYQDGQLGNFSVRPVNDSLPGKPPKNISVISIKSTSIQVTWACADCGQHNTTLGFLVSYQLKGSNMTTSHAVNRTTRMLMIGGLKKFTNYTVYMASITSRGLGVASNSVTIRTKEDVPSLPPLNVRVVNTSSTSLLVTWDPVPSDQVNGILLGYLVTYVKHGEDNCDLGNVSTMLNSTVLSGLEKFTVYDVNIAAFTRAGNGPVANVTASTDQDVPSLPPVDILARNTSSTSLLVTWGPVPQNFTHGIVLGYLVLYKRKTDGNSSFMNATSQLESFELKTLDKYTVYVIRILAFTVKGNGVASNDTAARTHEDVPSLPPTNLTAHNTSSTSLRVTWQPVPKGHVHGVLRGYRLLFQVQGSSRYRNVTTVQQSFDLQGLEKFTNYSVRIAAFTVIGDGNMTVPVLVSTDEDVPSLSPQNVTSQNTSSTSLYVSWHEVQHGFVHGILLGYRVLFKPANSHAKYNVTSTAANTRETELRGLDKFTVYELTVLAFTRIGDGMNSTRILVSTDEDIPSLPPVGVAARNTSSTSISVSWGEVPEGFVHGILQGYKVFHKKVDDVNGSYVNRTTSTLERQLNIRALEKYTEYAVRVLAFTRKGDGAVSLKITVRTDEDVPSLPPQNVQSYNTSSTSLNVTWLEVPGGFVHGILRGYVVLYSKTKDNGANVMQSVVSHNLRHAQLTGLEKFTNYSIQVAAFTRIGPGARSPVRIVSTDEDVPSLPPQNVLAVNISSTALRITWDPVPPGFVHGILRGYRVLYRKTEEPKLLFTVISVPPWTRLTDIYYLEKFTNYTVHMLAFTVKGDGANSPEEVVSTDEDIPSKPPQNVDAKDRASATVIEIWWERLPDNTIHGILRGYYIWYGITKLGINYRDPIFPKDFRRKQVSASAEITELTGLESYATYNIRIAAFTSKGYGPIKEISTRTCRCRSMIPTNWWHNPPYVTSQHRSNNTESGGVILTVVAEIVQQCCRWCEEYGKANADITTDANGNKAEKPGVIQVKDAISTQAMISFTIAGVLEQYTYHSADGDAEFVAIMETPGVAFVVADKRDIHKEVLLAILSCWPPVVIACIMTYLAGIVIWVLDMHWNQKEFPKSFISGSLEGFWWSFVTMTTVGYGDRIPKSVPARMFAYVWTLTGIATVAVITSSVTASLMSMVFQPEKMIYGTRLAAIANSTEYKLGLRRNAIFESDRVYGNMDEIYEDLKNDRVGAALLDSYSTASESKKFSTSWLRVIEIIPVRYHSANGVVLSGDAMKLARCFRDYVTSERDNIHRIIEKNVGSIEADDIPFAVKTSSDLLTAESYVYRKAIIILGGALGSFTLLGLLWHFCFRKKMNLPDSDAELQTPKEPTLSRGELRDQLKMDVKQFYDGYRKNYIALRRKHINQLKQLQIVTNHSRQIGVVEIRRLEFPSGRKGHYEVTKAVDVNSIFEGLDIAMFDKRDTNKWFH